MSGGACWKCAEYRDRIKAAEERQRPESVEGWEAARALHLKTEEPHRKDS